MYDNTKQCETCAYHDTDEYGEFCSVNLDEDELGSFYSSNKYVCPYYRFYDEYKMVQKQN